MRILPPLLALACSLVLVACSPESSDSLGDDEKSDAIGNGTEDESCSWDWQCRIDDSLICRPSSANVGEPDERCSLPGEARALCGDDHDCDTGFICKDTRFTVTGGVLVAGNCVRGEAESCWFDFQCSDDDVCRPSSDAISEPEYRCQPLGTRGDFCGDDDECSRTCSDVEHYAHGSVLVAGFCE